MLGARGIRALEQPREQPLARDLGDVARILRVEEARLHLALPAAALRVEVEALPLAVLQACVHRFTRGLALPPIV